MKPVPTALSNFIALTPETAVLTDLYTLSLVGGEVLRWTGGTTAITLPSGAITDPNSLNYNASNAFALGPRFGRSKVSTKIGVAPTELDIEIYAGAEPWVGTFSLPNAAALGFFDGATIELDRLVGTSAADTSLGAMVWFYGRVADIDVGRSVIKIKVKSLMNLLAIQQMPRRLYGAACSLVFGDSSCGYNRVTGVAGDGTTGGPAQITITAAPGSGQFGLKLSSAISANIFDYVQGTLIGVTGQNAGYTRSIASISPDGKTLAQFKPWYYPVAIGDTFHALPGCDHSTTGSGGCQNRNNLKRFGGFPYIPPPEAAA